MSTKAIKSALISVFHKDGLAPIVKKLDELGVTIYSTGGTEKFIKGLGIPVVAVEDITSYPSILGGRVKTLHPKVFGGILNRQDHEGDVAELKEYDIPQIDFEALARKLAANAGIDWDRLDSYPGYSRNAWREKARELAELYTQSI